MKFIILFALVTLVYAQSGIIRNKENQLPLCGGNVLFNSTDIIFSMIGLMQSPNWQSQMRDFQFCLAKTKNCYDMTNVRVRFGVARSSLMDAEQIENFGLKIVNTEMSFPNVFVRHAVTDELLAVKLTSQENLFPREIEIHNPNLEVILGLCLLNDDNECFAVLNMNHPDENTILGDFLSEINWPYVTSKKDL